ncbi:hypothetical protein [Caulobacter sp. NIBR1757]|uniref:hypothetical protein n=1 Tax=Caulobacter sp. NIBR1757 TaxID=3016000 RepID=UPI0022F08206|nr:hypothetical protein [Caulobacter sp. NIBR1757]WGM39755.1 hypothetical protein AMEJIAPC_02682 [Caulobacter sp. NIBR1757]
MPSKLFFSSCFDDPERQRLNIRDRVMALNPPFDRDDPGAAANLPVWLAESHKVLDPNAPTLPLSKAMFCVSGVRESDVYVAVARSRHGSGVELSPGEQVQASYFELELFEAALLRKPAHIFLLKGAPPSPRLEGLLRLLAPAFPGLSWTPLDEDEIFHRVEALLERQTRPNRFPWLAGAVASGKRMADRLTGTRYQPYDPLDQPPGIQFLNGLGDPAATEPSRDVLEHLLAKADLEADHHGKLTFLWMAIRELMGAPPSEPRAMALIPYWDRALSAWNSAGAWYGLHGHPLMGCLAALGSLSRIRAANGDLRDAPHGALASEYYSIAKTLGAPWLKAEVLKTSSKHIDAAFLKGASSGNHALRGSILQAMGDRKSAIADYERTVDLRRNHEAATPGSIGDALSELGFALVRSRQTRRGLDLMEEGVALLESEPPSGFLVRAKRKLGRAYLMAGAPLLALDTLSDAHELATRYAMLDQISQIDRLAGRINRRSAR